MARDPVVAIRKFKRKRMTRRKGKANWINRKSVSKWLETHVWNAKRMKMIEKWGVKIALKRNQRSFRFMHRCSQTEAVLNDKSYNRVIEIVGKEHSITLMFDALVDPTIASPSSSKYIRGEREGKTFLHSPFCYPSKAVSPISFLWKSFKSDDDNMTVPETRTVWIFVHVSSYSRAIECITSAIGLLDLSDVKLDSAGPKLTRFELTGPKSHSVLVKALDLTKSFSESHSVWKLLEGLESPSTLHSGAVLGIEINDPRLRFPVSKNHPISKQSSDDIITVAQNWPSQLSISKIWEVEFRQNLKDTKSDEKSLQCRRQEQLIPGTPLEPLDTDSKIPLLLIRRSDIAGWVLILPEGWGMALWQSLIYSGARAGGLEDDQFFHFEAGLPCFPNDYYESESYLEEALQKSKDAFEKHNRKPKAKRVNYESLGIKEPFRPAFESLSDSSIVVHSPRVVHYINQNILSTYTQMIEKVHSEINLLIKHRNCFPRLNISLESSFVRILLTVSTHGLIKHNGHVYIPTSHDLQLSQEELLVFCFNWRIIVQM
jgi:ribonuclease P/MRP protein subunit POP1